MRSWRTASREKRARHKVSERLNMLILDFDMGVVSQCASTTL